MSDKGARWEIVEDPLGSILILPAMVLPLQRRRYRDITSSNDTRPKKSVKKKKKKEKVCTALSVIADQPATARVVKLQQNLP